jgi:Alpha 1,4-glycosyltransferase conserved region/Glycosyltransferase sugar-binding region containing DXD motif
MNEIGDHPLAVSTFWHGPDLSSLEIACLMSFVRCGYKVTVFGYDAINRLPSEVTFVDAREILESSWLDKFQYRGRPSFQAFSNLFRYTMIKKIGSVWIDSDFVCLNKFYPSKSGDLFALESSDVINNAVLTMNRTRPELDEIISRAKAVAGSRDLVWGSTGPTLLTEVLGKEAVRDAPPPSVFYPIGYEEWWKPFLPAERGFCERQCAQSSTIHLWNNKIEKSGYWKDLAPPVGSFLSEVFRNAGLLDVFKETCPLSVMTQIAENYASSKYDIRHLRLVPLTKIATGRWMSAFKTRVAKKALSGARDKAGVNA